MFYRQLRIGVADDKYKLIPVTDKISDHVKMGDPFKDYYTSIYKYNQQQYEEFQKTGSIKGVDSVVSDNLTFDFDKAENPEEAVKDAATLCNRLKDYGIPEKDILISYSGSKGIHVQVNIDEDISVAEFKAITKQIANGLDTFDKRINDHARPFRVLGSVHKKSGLFKIPLTYDELCNLTLDEIKEMAKSLSNVDKSKFNPSVIKLPESIKKLKTFAEEYKPKVTTVEVSDIDWKIRPKNFTNCRWGLYNGIFGQGDRNNALLCLASTFKNQGDNQDICYRRLKGVAETQSRRENCERYPDNELFNNIISVVYSDSWKGGQFTCRDQANWLHDYCESLGEHKCDFTEDEDLKPTKFVDLAPFFKDYVVNIDKNTIYSGLPSLDKHVFLSTGAYVLVLGAPGSGKTSIGLELLNNTSLAGVRSVCASLDMAKNRFFEKIMYRLTGLDRLDLYKIFQDNNEQELLDNLDRQFGNVNFFKKSSATVQDLKDYIISCNEGQEEKIKLVVVDYFERLNSDMSDDTAASKAVAGELQDLVDSQNICLIVLVQPNKNALAGGPDSPIYDYTKIKGSSFVYQAARIILSCWRPFYNPKDFSKDHYMQMAVLKNDLGELSEFPFKWVGKTGCLSELEDNEKQELDYMLREKADLKNAAKGDSW